MPTLSRKARERMGHPATHTVILPAIERIGYPCSVVQVQECSVFQNDLLAD